MKRLFPYLLTLLLTVLPTACVYDFDPGVSGGGKAVIIEGDILAGDYTLVQISNLQALDVSEGVSTIPSYLVTVTVESENGESFTGVPENNQAFDNLYYRVDTRTLDLSSRCRLKVVIQNDVPGWWSPSTSAPSTYVSDWQEILQSESVLDSLTYVVSPEKDQLDIRIHTKGKAEGFYRWIGQEIWEYTSEYHAIVYYNPGLNQVLPYESGVNYFYCWKRNYFRDIMVASTESQGVSRFSDYTLYSTRDRQDLRFCHTYSLTLFQERISREAYDYWTSMRNNSSDVGGLFSPQPSDIRGNIHNVDDPSEYVIGYISASTVTKAQKYYRNVVGRFGQKDFIQTTRVVLKENQWKSYYNIDYVPLWVWVPDDEEPQVVIEYYEWAPRRCVDCRMMGGTKNVPADWPNNDT